MSEGVQGNRIYTAQFWLLCASSLFFFGSFNMMIPELPAYLTSMGGGEFKGLIIALFTVTAMVSRPFSGKLADRIGRKPVILFGSVVCFFCSLLYPVASSVLAFFLIRLIHGFSTGFTPTGQSTYLSDVIPTQRRGEAMGLLGTAGSVGMAAGPVLGGFLTIRFGIHTMFYASSFLGMLAGLLVLGVRETLPVRSGFSLSSLKIGRSDLFEPMVIVPCVVMVLSAYAFGAAITLLPDFGQHMGFTNKGYLFAWLTVASLSVRLVAGKVSDMFGRAPVMMVAMVVLFFSMLMVGFAHSQTMLIVGVILYGWSQGATSPTLLAWATDLADDHHKGRAIASVYISMELGIGLGALVSGIVYGNNAFLFPVAFGVAASLAIAAFSFLLISRRSAFVRLHAGRSVGENESRD